MSIRNVIVASAVCSVLAAACANNEHRSESIGSVAQHALGDADLTLRATTTTPAGGTPAVFSADAPVTSSTAVVSQFLEGNWNPNMLRLGAPPTYPEGWTLGYYAGATLLAAAPTTPAAWASVTRVMTSGSFQAGGSLTGAQVWENHASAPPPQVASSFSGGSAGDGWDVFFDPAYTKVFNIHHHSSPATVMCRDLRTSATCPGFPITLTQTSNRATGFVDGPTNKLWHPTVVAATRKAAWDCVDLTTAARCAPTPTVSSTLVATLRVSGYDGVADPVVIGRKIYALEDTPTNATISCFDMATGTECPPIATTRGILSWPVDGETSVGTRLYFRIGAQLDCYDTATSARCSGSWPQAVAATRPVRAIPSADSSVNNVCADYQCFALDGTVTTLPAEFLTYANANRTGGFSGSTYSNANFGGTRAVWGTGSQRLACFDIATKAKCAAAWPIFVSQLYSAKVDPLNTNCIWSNGNDGTIRNYDVPTGNQGCTSPPPIITFAASTAVPRLSCDRNNRVGSWQSFTLTNPVAANYTSATLTIKDSGGVAIGGYTNLPIPANGAVDLASLATAVTGQTPTFVITPVGLTNLTTPTADFKISGPAPQLCWTLTPPSNCPVTSSVVAKGAETLQGGAVTSYTDQTLGINSGTAGALGCDVLVAPANPTLWPRAMQTFTASGGSGSYAWSITTTSGATIDAVTGSYTAGLAGNVSDVVTATDTFGTKGTSTITVGPGVTVNPPTASLLAGETQLLTASGGAGFGFSFVLTTNLSGGSVDGLGNYRAGPATGGADVVTVTDEIGNFALVNISVVPPLVIAPTTATVAPRGSLAFTASGGSGGNTWAVSTNSSTATVDANGLYTAGITPSVGDVVTVTDAKGRAASATIAVGAGVSIDPSTPTIPPSGALTLTASGGSGTGYIFTLSANLSNGSITPEGQYLAGSTPAVRDTVSVVDSLGNTASVAVQVSGGVTILPVSPTATPLGTVSFTAAGGSGTGYIWSVLTNLSHGSISALGVYKAGTTGSVTDTVAVTDSLGNTATVEVVVGVGLTILPSTPSTPPLGSITFSSSGGSDAGLVWSVSNNLSGGSIDPATGVYVAGTQGGVSDTIRVLDSLGNVAAVNVSVGGGIAINPAVPNAPPKGRITLTASGGSGTGYTFALSTNLSGGTITADGHYVAGSIGAVIDVVTATDSLGNIAMTNVTVGAAIAILPNPATATPRGTVTFTAAGGSSSGYSWSLRTNASQGTISSAGVYTAGTLGGTTDTVLVADSLGNSAVVSVAVSAGLSIMPASPAVFPQGSFTFTSSGGSDAGFVWEVTSNLSGGSIDPTTGVYQAGAQGNVADTITLHDSQGNVSAVNVSVGGGIAINPAMPSVPPKGAVTFTAIGGNGGPYTFTIPTNASGATVVDGKYVAGVTGSVTDIVQAVDALGNKATVSVVVGAGLTFAVTTQTAAPHGQLILVVSGGSGTELVWDFVTNGSGGTVELGVYVAGPGSNATDVVRVTDALGNTATVEIHVGPGITISPSEAIIEVDGSQAFTAAGGQGAGYTWSLAANGSGGSIDPVTGAYRAGLVGATSDVIQVMDALGNGAQATVTIPAVPVVIDAGAPLDAAPEAAAVPAKDAGRGDTLAGGGGCTCTVHPRSSSNPWAIGAALALAGVVAARRRGRRGELASRPKSV